MYWKAVMGVAAISAAVGCGSSSSTVTDAQGNKVEWSQDGQTVTSKSSTGAEVKWDGKSMSGKNEKGESFSMGAGQVSQADLGLSFYPGSEATEGRDMRVEADGKNSFVSYRTSKDAPAKITEFYKDKVKEATNTNTEKMAMLTGKLEDGRKVAIMGLARDDGTTEVQISVSNEK